MKSQQYDCLNTTCVMTSADIPVEMGDSLKAPALDEELQTISGCWEREWVFSKDKPSDKLSAPK